jgi:aminoglycoside 3-N-acetyltransferase
MAVTVDDIRRGLEMLGLSGAQAEVHTSLSSFGYVEGGAGAVVEALTGTLATVLVPTFCFEAMVAPPPGDRPARNGLTYAEGAPEKPARPFDPQTSPVDPDMGIVPRSVLALPGACRSGHPLLSWTACGVGAEELARDHPWDRPQQPLQRLAQAGGYVVLLGVGLTACTAIHLAEELVGRAPFIRWVRGRDGAAHRARCAGCSAGFDQMLPYLQDVLLEVYIGPCRVLCAPLPPLLERAVATLQAHPSTTICADACLECRDSAAGGPLETA